MGSGITCSNKWGLQGQSKRVALIAIIDTHIAFRAQVGRALMSLYRVKGFPNEVEAIREMRLEPPSVILIDEMIGPRGGCELIHDLRQDPILANVPTVITSIHAPSEIADALQQCGADGCLAKPFRRSALIKIVSTLINRHVEANWNNLPEHERTVLKGTVEVFNNISDFIAAGEPVPYESVKDACAPLIDAVAKNSFKGILDGVKEHDNYSYVHSLRVATLLSLFGHTLGLKQEELLVLASGGLLHDAGKISIPHEVLNKQGPLTDDEFALMKSHVAETVKFLNLTPSIPKPVIIIAAQHHEKLDGSGYPNGLKGLELSNLARMASIVDVFSALTDRRVYKLPMAAEMAVKIMTDQMGHHLDQHFLSLFRTMLLDAVVD
ncbi:two-component system response regulator [Paramagnetospirillum kuznetsovii]|uniref:Two-component system response regulator n=1 Tax=Paramagnetospirillum kuznetsovii TaxID=2053833 RepID=A0A364NUQ6_9PROT|nr:HD domain-containing phosphohydrolase [Paramagnetospirillum kuznetsovii]RAU20796.1 two-component system response regulator [Paramagnetospirillum kuznetsovii]